MCGIVDKTMSSWLGKGNLSILEYADRLYIIPTTFITSGLLVVLLSHWSSSYYETREYNFKIQIKKAIAIIGSTALLLTIFLISFEQVIVKLVLGHGIFSQEKLKDVGAVWVCYLLGFAPAMVGLVFVRAYIVKKLTYMLMKIAFFSVVMNIVLNYILMRVLGVRGIALSTSITIILTTLIQIVVFYKISAQKRNKLCVV